MIDAFIKFILIIFGIWLAAVFCLFLFQRHFIYFPDTSSQKPQDWHLADMQEVKLSTADQLTLTAWYKTAQQDKPTLIYLHGNAGHLGLRAPFIRPYVDQGLGVLLVSYRGYAGNPGKPSETGLYEDAKAAYTFLAQKNIPSSCIVVIGESLGTAVAVELATKIPISALILTSPFTSMQALAQIHYPYMLSKWLLTERYDSLSKISSIHVPLLILHSNQDEIVPIAMAKTLFTKANEPKQFKIYSAKSHDVVIPTTLTEPIIEFIRNNVSCKVTNRA